MERGKEGGNREKIPSSDGITANTDRGNWTNLLIEDFIEIGLSNVMSQISDIERGGGTGKTIGCG